MELKSPRCLILTVLCCVAGLVRGQQQQQQQSAQDVCASCFGAGSIAAAVILTFLLTLVLVGAVGWWWKRYRSKKEHLILETDPEKGKGEYAFDNPGFKDATLPITKQAEQQGKLDSSKSKWNQWSPLTALTSKSEKRKTMDDTAIESFQGNEVKVIALRSHDFTGLGFNICGNMKEGIYIKDILHRGPAFESGKLNIGDRINSVTISFEHMVYEDALTILSYASPYEVIIEAKNGKLILNTTGQGGQPSHPVYRSSSYIDLHHMEKSSRKKLFGEDYSSSPNSNYSSLQKSRSNMTTLERKESKSPMPTQPRTKKIPNTTKNLTPEQLKSQLEQRIMADHQHNLKAKDQMPPEDAEVQKSESKYQKFGIRVLPMVEQQQKSPKIIEQNENNSNIEKKIVEEQAMSIDEVDEMKRQPPPIKKREKKIEESPEKKPSPTPFDRNSLNGSGIKRDENGIPQEMPTHMFNAAVAARRNRNSSTDEALEEDPKYPKRKGKAPSPPEEINMSFDEIKPLEDTTDKSPTSPASKDKFEINVQLRDEEVKAYNSDSDVETDNQSSVNTIELNSSEITIHQTEDDNNEDIKNRKTVSTGDLTKIKTRKTSNGTLERAQSLDISDSAIPTALNRKRKGATITADNDDFDVMKSEEDLFGKVMLNKEPRLSLILDGLTTFQRNRLKKSTEWGNLEDAILKLNQEDENNSLTHQDDDSISLERSSLNENTPEFDAVVNKINEIKRESLELFMPVEIQSETKIKNEIWPSLDTGKPQQTLNGHAHMIQEEKPPRVRLTSDKVITSIEEPEVLIKPIKPAVPPPPVKITTINNRINEPFEKVINMTQSTEEIRQAKPTVSPKPPPPVKTDPEVSKSAITFNARQRVPGEVTISPPPPQPKSVEAFEETDWKVSINDADSIMDTSPPVSLELVSKLEQEKESDDKDDETESVHPKLNVRPEEVLSKIPLLNTMVKNQREESARKPLLSTNSTDETKTVVTYNTATIDPNLVDVTQNFLYTEQLNCSQDTDVYIFQSDDTNISDDLKVSRHSHSSLERRQQTVPKSDDAKTVDNNTRHISNINVSTSLNGDQELHSLELSINNNDDKSELYTTAFDTTEMRNESIVTISTPDIVKNATLAEAIQNATYDLKRSDGEAPKQESSLITETKFLVQESPANPDRSADSDKGNSTLTYITEIEVTPTKSTKTNISEVEIIPNNNAELKSNNVRNIDTDFENYVKSFETKLERFENNIQDFDESLKEFIKEEPTSITINEKVEEQELNKIHEIAEEQLKKLPEMRFTTSSYESPSKIPEKRFSQIEMLRSNFEKPSPTSPPKAHNHNNSKPDVGTKSRIPISLSSKTPPTSPERRDSRNLENENDKAILELMSSSTMMATSTPYATSKYQIKSSSPSSKNVTVTSIRTNSKIPSGLPTLLSGRPPVAPRRIEGTEANNVQVSSSNNNNGNIESSSFKQWVFNPSNITNVTVTDHKEK